MTRIRIKRVYEPEAPEDGYRVLVDKLWPRGIRKEALRYDVWAKEIAPTPGLRAWFHAAPEERWEEFRRRYTGELRSSPAVRDFVRRIAGKDTVTLLYASKNAAGNHALILQEYLARATAAAGLQTSATRNAGFILPGQRSVGGGFLPCKPMDPGGRAWQLRPGDSSCPLRMKKAPRRCFFTRPCPCSRNFYTGLICGRPPS